MSVLHPGLCCPICRASLRSEGSALLCLGCGVRHPVVGGVPVLIDEAKSVFTVEEVSGVGPSAFDEAAAASPLWRRFARRLPSASLNLAAERLVGELVDRLATAHTRPRVLVIGGGILGAGMHQMVGDDRFEIVESDIFFGPRTAVLFDAHSIPFEDASFDAVVAQAVLEHVADPFACVDEIARVLRPGGLVYAGTAFMQQVHGGAYDFLRFTKVGHRRLFRRFEEIESGIAVGPGSALAWSWSYFLASFARSRRERAVALAVGRLTGFVWTRFDPFLARRRGAADAASAVFFVGAKGPDGWALSDREIVATYGSSGGKGHESRPPRSARFGRRRRPREVTIQL